MEMCFWKEKKKWEEKQINSVLWWSISEDWPVLGANSQIKFKDFAIRNISLIYVLLSTVWHWHIYCGWNSFDN